MLLSEWLDKDGRGALTRLHYASKVSYKTVWRASQGKAVRDYDVAERLSNATRPIDPKTGAPSTRQAPACSIEEIRFPERFQKRRRSA
jgi:hypothetical protein